MPQFSIAASLFYIPGVSFQWEIIQLTVAWKNVALFFSHKSSLQWCSSSTMVSFSFSFFTLFILYWGMVGGGLIAESCSTLATSWTVSPPSFSVHRISQARILEWVAISFSRRSSRPREQTHGSHTAGRFFTTRKPILGF